MSAALPPDVYTTVTARIIAALERGVIPWVRPWSEDLDSMPINADSRRPYRGINAILLALEATQQGYPLNRWLTYRQACELGGQVRRGEKGTTVILWRLRRVAGTADVYPSSQETDIPDQVIPLIRAFTVFNLAQADGLPKSLRFTARADWEPLERAEHVIRASGATFVRGGSQASYSPVSDEIRMPLRQTFATPGGYYATALHELTHWSAHRSRCDRQLGKRFGDAAYAAEELIAEMGSAFLCAHCRIDGQLQHESYLKSWLDVLRTDKRAIFVAATRAQQAADFILNLVPPAATAALAA
jgi:antirestriction protein ArdC